YGSRSQPENLEILESVQRAEDDLHRLFDETREYAAPIRLEPRTCNLAEVWRQAWTDLEPVREGRQAGVGEGARGTGPRRVARPSHLAQVFLNLLHNALAAADDPVRIVIRCAEAEVRGRKAVAVSVRDNGPGFTAEQRQMAFEPFFTTKLKGTG